MAATGADTGGAGLHRRRRGRGRPLGRPRPRLHVAGATGRADHRGGQPLAGHPHRCPSRADRGRCGSGPAAERARRRHRRAGPDRGRPAGGGRRGATTLAHGAGRPGHGDGDGQRPDPRGLRRLPAGLPRHRRGASGLRPAVVAPGRHRSGRERPRDLRGLRARRRGDRPPGHRRHRPRRRQWHRGDHRHRRRGL